ncbi:restriction endonuclease subunit S [Geodermatophilus sp. SYSU D01186]
MTSTWALSSVGEQFDVQLGKMLDAAKNVGVPKPYLGNRAVQWGRIDVSARGVVPMSRSDLQRYRLRDGDLLVCEGGEVGRGAIWRNELSECYYQKALHRLRPKSGYDVRLMLALLAYWSSTGAFADFVTQTSIAHLPREKFIQMPLPLPSELEQRRIGDVLQGIDDLISTLERLVIKKQAVKRGMMQQLLTGRTRLPGFEEAWRQVSLGSVATVTMGQSPVGSSYNSGGLGLPLIQGNADIKNRATIDRIWTTAPTKTCNADDVLLTVRAPVGYTAVASKASCLGRGVCALNAKADNRFLFHALVYAEPAWALYEQGSTFTAVNSNEVRSFSLAWPSDAEERAAIANLLDDVDRELLLLDIRRTKARDIKSGMMQQLLTGRTRLPVEATS